MIEVLFSMWLWKKLDERTKTYGLCNAVLWGVALGLFPVVLLLTILIALKTGRAFAVGILP